MQMVVMLAGIVEHGRILAERSLDDLLEGLAFEFGPLDRVVSVGHVSLMVLVVMEFQRFLGHIGGQGVVGIGQIGQREGHGVMSENDGRRGLTGTLIEGSIGLKHRNLTKQARSSVTMLRVQRMTGQTALRDKK
jgi:hypothetical protein